ncbi:VOC family protein [Mumia quercus]|uniref:VOC family protein n=1 Tax=Mumia quercus TaxID=2976125 RepID=UPI0021D0091E|nr:VOC family protein [Mumia quercus]
MITNISLVTLWVTDQDTARDFYVDRLGFETRTDQTLGDGFRWLTIGHPSQPELEVTLMVPGPPLDPGVADAVGRALENGTMSGLGLTVDDCQKTYDELTAHGVDFVQPPSERPYGVEAVMRDVVGNWVVLVERRPYGGEDFPHAG